MSVEQQGSFNGMRLNSWHDGGQLALNRKWETCGNHLGKSGFWALVMTHLWLPVSATGTSNLSTFGQLPIASSINLSRLLKLSGSVLSLL